MQKNHSFQGEKSILNQVKISPPTKTLYSKGEEHPRQELLKIPGKRTSTQDGASTLKINLSNKKLRLSRWRSNQRTLYLFFCNKCLEICTQLIHIHCKFYFVHNFMIANVYLLNGSFLPLICFSKKIKTLFFNRDIAAKKVHLSCFEEKQH